LTAKDYLWDALKCLGGGTPVAALAAIAGGVLPLFGVSPDVVKAYWDSTYWVVSFWGVLGTTVVYLVFRTRSTSVIRKRANRLVEEFYTCSLRDRIEGTWSVRVYYYIGLLGKYDWQETLFTVSVPDGSKPVKTIHFFIGSTGGAEESAFDRLQELDFRSRDVTEPLPEGRERLKTAVIPYNSGPGRTYITLCFTPCIRPGEERTFKVTFNRPGIWKALRRSGVDRGAFSPGPNRPTSATVNIVPPRGIGIDAIDVNATELAAERVASGALPAPQAVEDQHLHRQVFQWDLDTTADQSDRYSYEVKSRAIGGSFLRRALLAYVHRKVRQGAAE